MEKFRRNELFHARNPLPDGVSEDAFSYAREAFVGLTLLLKVFFQECSIPFYFLYSTGSKFDCLDARLKVFRFIDATLK